MDKEKNTTEEHIFLNQCDRCGKSHYLAVKKLSRAYDGLTHWGMCEVTNEPVMVQLITI
jgi:hypothetical protein